MAGITGGVTDKRGRGSAHRYLYKYRAHVFELFKISLDASMAEVKSQKTGKFKVSKLLCIAPSHCIVLICSVCAYGDTGSQAPRRYVHT